MAKPRRQPDKASTKHARGTRTTRYKPWLCFACGHVCDAASSLLGDFTPAEGDVSACINCTVPSIMRGGQWMPARAEDIAALAPETRRDLLKHQWAIEQMHKAMGRPQDQPGYDRRYGRG